MPVTETVFKPGTPTVNATTTPAPAEAPKAPPVVLKETPQVSFLVREFDSGDAKGVKYVVPQFKSVQGAVEYSTRPPVKDDKGNVTEDGTDGQAVILNMINQMVAQRIAMKVKSQKLPRVPTATEPQKAIYIAQVNELLKVNDGYAFSLAEAEAYKPGQREPSMAEEMEKMYEDIKAGKFTDVSQLQAKFLSVMSKKRGKKS